MNHVFITGGAGFIGANLSRYHLGRGDNVTVFDNLSRRGASANLEWLKPFGEDRLQVVIGDVRNASALEQAIQNFPKIQRVYHLAGQVAVTSSLQNPRDDFEHNAAGTFNVLEAVRKFAAEAALVYASTNKVYGALENLDVVEESSRYAFRDLPYGIPETQPVDFYSPYGCSKGAGDLYVRDYARSYGLRSVVFRQSCIYGPRQFGIEDQGWLAHFCIAALLKKPITIFGNGKQVRDLLWVEDLVTAYDAACLRIDDVRGEIFNIGGGPGNTMSIWCEIAPVLEKVTGVKSVVQYQPPRLGDQNVFVSDVRKAADRLDWRPSTRCPEGIEKMWRWVVEHRDLFIR